MPGTVCSIASTPENHVTQVRRDPVGVVSKVNFIDAGMFSSSALSSPSRASNELMGFTAANFQEPLHFPPSGKARKYSARSPTRKSLTREGGGREGWSPKALELARVGKGVPKALLRNGIVAHDGEGELCGVFGDRGQRHNHFRLKNIVELRHTLAPNGFEVFEELASAPEPRVVGGDQLLAAVCTLLNETRALEHGDVLLRGGEAHLVPRSKIGHRRRLRERPRQDVASRAIGQGTEQLVERLVALFSTYNHLVVRFNIARSFARRIRWNWVDRQFAAVFWPAT
jgi:hypothetical protein